MTTTQELIAILEQTNQFHDNADISTKDVVGVIESLSAEVERTEKRLHAVATLCATAEQERDQLRAQVEAQGEAVAEVLWYDPAAGGNAFIDQKPCKIIDASLAFFDSAPIGTKLYTHPAPAAPVVEQDRITEALRQALNKLPRYSFHLGYSNNVKCVPERTGKWIEWQQAHELFDPVAVDAALHPTQPKGEQA